MMYECLDQISTIQLPLCNKNKIVNHKTTNWPLKAGSTVHNGNCEQAIEATTMIVFRRHGQYCHTMEIRELFPRNNLI